MPGKKYADAAKKYDKTQLHEPAKAFELVKSLSNRNFDESVEVAFKLGVDPRKADQMLRSTVSLPCISTHTSDWCLSLCCQINKSAGSA